MAPPQAGRCRLFASAFLLQSYYMRCSKVAHQEDEGKGERAVHSKRRENKQSRRRRALFFFSTLKPQCRGSRWKAITAHITMMREGRSVLMMDKRRPLAMQSSVMSDNVVRTRKEKQKNFYKKKCVDCLTIVVVVCFFLLRRRRHHYCYCV